MEKPETDTRACWAHASGFERNDKPAVGLPMWREIFCAVEAALLHIAPIYYGFGSRHGDHSAVIVVPGFLGGDVYLAELYAWLYRFDYRPYYSGIRWNAECPNLLIRSTLNATIDRARRDTGRKVHLIGHSLGGVIAMSAAAQRPEDVASVVTLGAPFLGATAHPNILRLAERVRKVIQSRHGDAVLPGCYTGQCTCNFVDSLTRTLPPSMLMTAIYTRTDAIVDWHYCVTGDPKSDFEVPGTHIGLVFNPSVYTILANRLADAQPFTA
jgi:pimeloyl-ACP methyl ester carboxylesterase